MQGCRTSCVPTGLRCEAGGDGVMERQGLGVRVEAGGRGVSGGDIWSLRADPGSWGRADHATRTQDRGKVGHAGGRGPAA